MNKAAIALSIAVGALVIGGAANVAQAQCYYPAPVVVAPPVYAPAPVYVAPRPVYVSPRVYAPVYRSYYPRPVYRERPVYRSRGFSFGFSYHR